MSNVKINGLATVADMQFHSIEGGFGKGGGTNLSIVSVGGIAILLVMVIYTFWVWGDDNK